MQKKYNLLFLLLAMLVPFSVVFAFTSNDDSDKLEGRWDLTVNIGKRNVPSWLEVRHSGIRTLVGHFVADGGSARPISEVFFKDGKMSFTIPPQWDDTKNPLVVEGELKNNQLTGTMISPDGRHFSYTGVRAPKLLREKEPVWGKPVKIFNEKNLEGWNTFGKKNQWIVEEGILKSPRSGANIRTDKTFNDFKLHIEFKYPKESNSGVYLRGRYEIQIADSKGKEPINIELGGIYGFIDPLEMMAKDPDEWQSFDIVLVGRLVTIVANGKTIIYKQEIPGITGGAIDANEAEPGPIMMQGDHGSIEFRNIILTPAK